VNQRQSRHAKQLRLDFDQSPMLSPPCYDPGPPAAETDTATPPGSFSSTTGDDIQDVGSLASIREGEAT
jgi:hypothetical protein